MGSALLEKFAKKLVEEVDLDPLPEKAQSDNPKIATIVQVLEQNPLLVQPCLNWLNQKIREINGSTLSLLYTPAEIDELKAKAGVQPEAQ